MSRKGHIMLVAFDMFGTLADAGSVAAELIPACGARADEVALAWRGKQLEYMFRVTAMGQFPHSPSSPGGAWPLRWPNTDSRCRDRSSATWPAPTGGSEPSTTPSLPSQPCTGKATRS